MNLFEETIKLFFISYFFIYNSVNLILVIVSFLEVKFGTLHKLMHQFDAIVVNPHLPGVTILMPAYNEEKGIIQSIHSVLRLNYPKLEVVIINDGSTDGTLRRIKKHFHFEKSEALPGAELGTAEVLGVYELKKDIPKNVERILLIDKANGGKADALNVGVNYSKLVYVCSMDADSIIDEEAILQIMRMLTLKKKKVLAIGGQVGIVNGCEVKEGQVTHVGLPPKWITMFQFTEYIRSFVAGRTALASLKSLLVLSGVFSIFDRESVIKIGGYLTRFMDSDLARKYVGKPRGTVCEDMEIVVRLHRYIQEEKLSAEVAFYPHPIAWTEAPERWKDLGKQRDRWFRGLAESLTIHRKMFLNPFYKQIGLFAMPYQVLFEFLGPLIEMAGYATLPLFLIFGNASLLYLAWFFTAAILYGGLISFLSIILGLWLEEDWASQKGSMLKGGKLSKIIKVVLFALASNLFYRQYIVLWQLRGFIGFLKKKEAWEKLERKGLG